MKIVSILIIFIFFSLNLSPSAGDLNISLQSEIEITIDKLNFATKLKENVDDLTLSLNVIIENLEICDWGNCGKEELKSNLDQVVSIQNEVDNRINSKITEIIILLFLVLIFLLTSLKKFSLSKIILSLRWSSVKDIKIRWKDD